MEKDLSWKYKASEFYPESVVSISHCEEYPIKLKVVDLRGQSMDDPLGDKCIILACSKCNQSLTIPL